ncbi:MAG: lipocalin family protein [Pricia sp.]
MSKNRVLIPSILLGLGAFLFFGCTKDDDTEPEPEEEIEEIDAFYKNAITSAKPSDILGTWSFYEVEFEGRKTDVPVDYESCDRDHFNFGTNGIYTEYLITDSGCAISEFESKWDVDMGVIVISSFTAEDQELVVVELTDKKLTIKARFDSDDDGDLEIFALSARRYEPKDRDVTADTFIERRDAPLNDKIQFEWQPYAGQNTFVRYEIYRSAEVCDMSNAELIATYNESDQTYFFDENPPVTNQLCYLLRVYTDKGPSSESGFQSVYPEFLDVVPVEMSEPTVSDNSIQINWEASVSPYFSHYEIGVQNHNGSIGYGYREEVLDTVKNIGQTSYIDNNPPYFINPVYTIKVYDIFGNENYAHNSTVQSSRTASFKRLEVLEFSSILSTTIDPGSSTVYFFGGYQDSDRAVQKYNYGTKTVEATATGPTLNYENSAMHWVNSQNGKEIILTQSNTLQVYGAQNLNYKYKLDVEQANIIDDFSYLGNNLWALIDEEDVFIYKRDNSNFELVDNKEHYGSISPLTNRQQIIILPNNRMLVTRNGEAKSVLFAYDGQGKLIDKKEISLSLNSDNRVKAEFNTERNHIVDYATNRIYSASDFSLIRSFESPYYPSGMTADGKYILGTNNDPEWILEGASHEKRVISLDLNSNSLSDRESIGYPHLVFENHLGQIISISSGLKRATLAYPNPKPDIFVEIIRP